MFLRINNDIYAINQPEPPKSFPFVNLIILVRSMMQYYDKFQTIKFTQAEFFRNCQRLINDFTKEAQNILVVQRQSQKNELAICGLLAQDESDKMLDDDLLKIYSQIMPCTDINETVKTILNEPNPTIRIVISCKIEVKAPREEFIPNSFGITPDASDEPQADTREIYQKISDYQPYDIKELLDCKSFGELAKLVHGPRLQDAQRLHVLDHTTALNTNRPIAFIQQNLSKILHIDQLRQQPSKVDGATTGMGSRVRVLSKRHVLRVFIHKSSATLLNSGNLVDFLFSGRLRGRDTVGHSLRTQGATLGKAVQENAKPQGPGVSDLERFVYQNRQFVTYAKAVSTFDGTKVKYKDRDIFFVSYTIWDVASGQAPGASAIQLDPGIDTAQWGSQDLIDVFIINGMENNLKALQQAQKKNIVLLQAEEDYVSEYVEKQKNIVRVRVSENAALNHSALAGFWRYINQILFD